jgi:perosamine synthetase
MERLGREGIQAKPYLPSIHLQPYYRELFGTRAGMFPVAEATSARSLALPFHAGIAAADQERVAEAVSRAVA